MTQELEFQISQYLDGALPAAEVDALNARLHSDPGARNLLAEYQRLNEILVSAPLPEVKWEAFAQSISHAIDAAEEEKAAQTYRLPRWVRLAAPLSLAASILIAAGIGFRVLQQNRHRQASHSPVAIITHPSPIQSAMLVVGPQAEAAHGAGVAEISIGPAEAIRNEPAVVHYSDDIVSRPARVTVASGVAPAQDMTGVAFDIQ